MFRASLRTLCLLLMVACLSLPTVPADAQNAAPQGPSIIAHFHLNGALTEKPQEDPFGLLAGQITSLKTLLERLEKARLDNSVKAVVITYNGFAMGAGQLEEIHRAIAKFKEAGKPVLVHVDSTYLSLPLYVLLSAGSNLTLEPLADVWITGLYGEGVYAKTLLDKIGIEADFMHLEDYKSAAELFTNTGPSAAAEANMNWLMDGLYESLVGLAAKSRGVSPEEVGKWIDAGIHTAAQAQELGIVDAVQSRETFLNELKASFGPTAVIDNNYAEPKALTIDFNNPFAIFSLFSQLAPPARVSGRPSIAIIYIEGTIMPGYGQANPLTGAASGAFSGDIRRALEQAAADNSVKAVVLRVDSPGGSALASDIILRATEVVKAKKPLVVSMGNVAGSGGYYVSCGANAIFADEMTLTASIGVVGGKLVTAEMWNKLGVNWHPYQRGANADFLVGSNRFTDSQRATFHSWMTEVYDVFKKHVTDHRGDKLTKPISEMAGGRVFTGKQAKELGLIDKLGGLQDAIEYTAQLAQLSDYETRVIPKPVNPLETILAELSGAKGEQPSDLQLGGTTGEASAAGSFLPGLDSAKYQTLTAMLAKLEPKRAAALQRALLRIELIQSEGVILMPPIDLIIH